MVKLLIVYDSITGNVEAMAEAVKKGIIESGGEATILNADQVDSDILPTFDGYAFGSPTHCGTMSTKMNDFFNNKLHKHWGKLGYKTAVGFTSGGGQGGGNEILLQGLISVILNFGLITFGVPDYVSDGMTLHYGAIAVKHPSPDELEACKLLGAKLVEYTRIVQRGTSDKP
jgi:NAD(P)H dehydrogenase (quinone)